MSFILCYMILILRLFCWKQFNSQENVRHQRHPYLRACLVLFTYPFIQRSDKNICIRQYECCTVIQILNVWNTCDVDIKTSRNFIYLKRGLNLVYRKT